MIWPAAKINDERQDEQPDDGDDLDAGEDELRLAIDLNRKDVQADDQNDDDGDPRGGVDGIRARPVVDDNRSG